MSNINTASLGMEDISKQYDYSAFGSDLEETLKQFQLLTERVKSFSSTLSENPKKNFNESVTVSSFNEKTSLAATLPPNYNVSDETIASTNTISLKQERFEIVKDSDKALSEITTSLGASPNAPINSKLISSETQTSNTQLTEVSSETSKNENDKANQAYRIEPLSNETEAIIGDANEIIIAAHTFDASITLENNATDNKAEDITPVADHKRKQISPAADVTSTLKKRRLDEQPAIDTSVSTISPFSKSYIIASAPTFNWNAFTGSSFPPRANSFPSADPTNIAAELSSKNKQDPPDKADDFITEYLIPISFTGIALTDVRIKNYNSAFALMKDSQQLKFYLQSVEALFEMKSADLNEYWYKYFDACFELKKKDNPTLYAWFKEELNATLPYHHAKSIMINKLGITSVKTRAAIKSQLESGQSTRETIEGFFYRYHVAANAALELEELDPLAPDLNFSINIFLKEGFVQGLKYDKKFRAIFDKWRGNLSLWEDFAPVMLERIDVLAGLERSFKTLDFKERKKRAWKAQKKRNAKLIGTEAENWAVEKARIEAEGELARATQKRDMALLIAERKKQGLCTFCGTVKLSNKHHRTCDARRSNIRVR